MFMPNDYSKYPFLKVSAEYLKNVPDLQQPIVKIIETDFGMRSLDLAKTRLTNAITKKNLPINGAVDEEIASFFFARVLLSIPSPVNKSLIEKFITYETDRFYRLYTSENNSKKSFIEKDLQISFMKRQYTLTEYIPISIKLIQSSARWKLVNMKIVDGIVDISELTKSKFDTKSDAPDILFFKEQIKHKLRSTMPMKIDKETRSVLEPIAKEIFGEYINTHESGDYGEVTPSNYPPCIQHIIDLIQKHENPTHSGRFALVTFLHEIGLPESDIITIFQTVRDFDMSQTIYQIQHISGQQGTPAYKCPACDTMKTNGLCMGSNNSLCAKVKHPLGYYQAKHKFATQQKNVAGKTG